MIIITSYDKQVTMFFSKLFWTLWSGAFVENEPLYHAFTLLYLVYATPVTTLWQAMYSL
jgi:hypothetical protein